MKKFDETKDKNKIRIFDKLFSGCIFLTFFAVFCFALLIVIMLIFNI